MNDNHLLRGALEYAAAGYYVFPCEPEHKVPLEGTHGFKDATVDLQQIEAWWVDREDANVAVACGASNLFVVDVDSYNEPEALGDHLALLDGSHPWINGRDWPGTYTTRTASGGLQFWFSQPEEGDMLRNGASVLRDNIDQRGDGGYIVAPPSIAMGKDGSMGEYVVLRNDPVARVPDWIVETLRKPTRKNGPMYVPQVVSNPWVTPYGSAALHAECEELAGTVYGRNDKLNGISYRMGRLIAAGQLDRGTVEERLWSAAARASDNGNHPLTSREIDATMRSGLDKGLLEPAHVPEGTRATPPPPPAPQPAKKRKVNIRPVDEIEDEEHAFLWGNRLAVGGINVLAGDGGIGKSYQTIAIAAALAHGFGLPEQTDADQGSSVLITYEDSPSIVKGRFAALGLGTRGPYGEVLHIHASEFFAADDEDEAPIQFAPEHVGLLMDTLREVPNLKLVVVDPVMSFLGDKVDVNTDNQVRGVLHRLVGLAEELKVAVLIVAHTKKGTPDPTRILDSIAGSVAIKNIARSAVIGLRDPDDTSKTCLFHEKHNWTAPADALAYRFDDNTFTWQGAIAKDDIHRIFSRSSESLAHKCARWLAAHLMTNGGQSRSAQVRDQGEEAGFGMGDLLSAKASLRVVEENGFWMFPLNHIARGT